MPKLSAFPKGYMDELTLPDENMSIFKWIEMAATLGVDGLEFYCGFRDLQNAANLPKIRAALEAEGLVMPMLCCSPDFTHPDQEFRDKQIALEKEWINMTAELGGEYCRVLSGQRRPEISRSEGVDFTVGAIEACLPHAEKAGVKLIIENHYKDNYWKYPEFAQKMDIFCEIVDRIDSPIFGVNYDPSNTLLAGEEPLELLERVKHRVLTMHASDRYLSSGTIEDLRKEEDSIGYASRLEHGVIGQGMNDYDAIFGTLAAVGFDSWISIEDGVSGMEDLQLSVDFLREKIGKHWPAT